MADDKLTIDGKEYALSELSEAAKDQVTNVQVTDQEIARLQRQFAIVQTARAAYARALQEELNES